MKKLIFFLSAVVISFYSSGQDRIPLSFPTQSVFFNPSMTGNATNNFQTTIYGFNEQVGNSNFTKNALLNYDHHFDKINSTFGINLSYNDKAPSFYGRSSDNYEIGLLYNYRLQLSDSLSIRFGIRGSYLINESDFVDPFDLRRFIYSEYKIPPNQTNTNYNLDLGVSLYWRNMQFGAGVKRINEPEMKDKLTNEVYEQYPAFYYFNLEGDVTISNGFRIETGGLVGYSAGFSKSVVNYHSYGSAFLNTIIAKRIVLGYNMATGGGTFHHGVLTAYRFNKFSRIFLVNKTRSGSFYGLELGANIGF